MAKQILSWTALPNGFDADGNLRISALLAPRLVPDADQVLKPLRDFIDWPGTIRNSRFTLHYGAQIVSIPGGQTAGPSRVDNSVDVADSPTWAALFSESTPVSGFVFQNLTGISVLSYDTVAMNNLARTLYSSLAHASGDSLPKITQILGDPNWQGLIDAVAILDGMFWDEKTGLRNSQAQFDRFLADGLNLQLPLAAMLARAQLFHTPPSLQQSQDYSSSGLDATDPRITSKTNWRTYKRTALPAPTDFAKIVDFHQIVAAMSSYPRLLRRLGIVIDFVVAKGTFTPGADQLLSVVCDLGTPDAGIARSQSNNTLHARLSTAQFVAVPKAAVKPDDLRVHDGLLDLNPNQFAVLQADVDGAGLKLMNFARTLRPMSGDPHVRVDAVTKFEKQAGAPALRNAGLMLVQHNRANMLQNSFANAKTLDDSLQRAVQNPPTGLPPQLWAEDVVRGWRVDIWDDKSGKWHSLCERKSTHSLGGISVDDDREGFLRLAATKSSDGNNPKLKWLHEALMTWAGWSMVAPHPGQVVDTSDKPAAGDAEVPPGLPMQSVFTPRPGSLPRLRYGRSYRVRARMADLAANSLPANDADFGPAQPATTAVKYCRFDPVQPASLALIREGGVVEKPLEGETMNRLAIRTFNNLPSDNTIPTTATARRYSVPARSTVKDCELHGMLDAAGIVDGSVSMFNLLSTRDASLAEVKLLTPGPLEDSATVETTYAVLDSPGIEIPYLPDALCLEIAARVFDHPGFPAANIIHIPVYGAGAQWPKASPFVIRLFEDSTQVPHFDATTRTLQIPMPKATRATLRLSARLFDPTLMGVWDWLPAADQGPVATLAKEGQHWALTPWRTVEIVHAVQKPLIAPQMKFILSRNFGDTRALPRFASSCSLISTARVDLQAHWHEPNLQAAGHPEGADREKMDHAFSIKITDPQSYAMAAFVPGATGVPEHEIIGPEMIGVNENRDKGIKYHEFNDTRYRRIEYWLEATSRFREYMPANVLTKSSGGGTVETDENIKVTGPTVVTWVPNSAPPPSPQVLYVVPTFGWSTGVDAQGNQTRWRRGGGLRVYLDLPWNVSGYGEMLAVVLPQASFAGDPNTAPAGKPYKKFVTQWGNDPVWESNFVTGTTPKPANFPLARTAGDPTGSWLPPFAPATESDQPPGPFWVAGLSHPGLAAADIGGLVDIAPHDVSYDPDRHLWYCDIDINFGSAYFPFVRLALARYQPVSLSNAYLSNIVLADFLSLAPDRWMTVNHATDPKVRTVHVYGYSYTDNSGNREAKAAPSTLHQFGQPENPVTVSPTSVVEVWVEKLDPSRGEDFGWTRDPTALVIPAVFAPVLPVVGPATQAHAARALPVGPIVVGPVNPVLLWPQLWQGTVTLPQAPGAGTRYRLVVAEYEEYLVDDASPYNLTPSAKGRRLVFVDHVELA